MIFLPVFLAYSERARKFMLHGGGGEQGSMGWKYDSGGVRFSQYFTGGDPIWSISFVIICLYYKRGEIWKSTAAERESISLT